MHVLHSTAQAYYKELVGATNQFLKEKHTKKAPRCGTLTTLNCHAAGRKHEGRDTAPLPKPRQGKSRGRGQVRATHSVNCALTT
ncbi:hypothetical protein T265_00166 [Opisthorchis viverrini]|uniref:Uncharacterized protein n=1 Tax=Opisthorchis viverrini TaxID=6198 RepID=A0A075ADM5_OPIVI|nr:hypothetical protein T265_00166 [Opisthorchis viverrini]KER34325.1 hypothetical protein T265_00166 [Opisthorchis viverrini]